MSDDDLQITPHDRNTCMDCGRPLVPCTCHEGCPGGMCPVQDCTKGTIVQLKAALIEACDLADKANCSSTARAGMIDRIAALRRIAEGE